jgi:hypothetical protein
MFTFDSRRIAWHLHLQSILKFQRHFLAPRFAFKNKHLRTADDAGEENSPRISEREAELPGSKRYSLPAAGQMGVRNASLPGSPLPISGKLQKALGHLSSATPAQVRTSSWGARPLIRSAVAAGNHVSGARAVQLNEPAIRGFRRPEIVAWTALSLPAYQNVAGSGAGAGRSGTLRFYSPSRRSPITAGAVEASSLGVRPPPIEAGSEEAQSAGAGRSSRSYLSDDSLDEGRTPHSARASVLHIDGAVLARWTVQHLERALGGPTSGMTGIDPRAGLPRNRVSPF